jgi:hypothetical protein
VTTDIRGDAIAITEKPDSLRRKVEFLRKRAVGRVWQTREITDAVTLVLDDYGTLLKFNKGTDFDVTLPIDLPEGWWVVGIQTGAGKATFLPDTGATVESTAATDRTLAQYGRVRIDCISNSDGASAFFVVSGDVG